MNMIANASEAAPPPGSVRCLRERVIQTLWFEGLGLAIVSLPFASFSGMAVGDSVVLLVVLAVVVTFWSALYNTAFDLTERRFTERVASDRPQRWRVLHALTLEVSAVVVTWPLVVALTTLGWLEALVADFGLTLAYSAYGYVFHLAFDRVRPVWRGPGSNE